MRLLAERTAKLEGHFRQAQEDVGLIATSAKKSPAARRASTRWNFGEDEAGKVEAPPHLRLAKGGE